MKLVISIFAFAFALTSCSNSSDSPAAPATVTTQEDPLMDEVKVSFLAGELLARYNNWQEVKKSIQAKPEGGESYNLANEFTLGNYLRSLSKDPATLLIVRTDFKTRQGRQYKEDFLTLAKKIYKQTH